MNPFDLTIPPAGPGLRLARAARSLRRWSTPRAMARPRPPRVEGRARGPNILILVGDDHAGGTLGIDGDPRRATPRLDALARQGVRFDRAYCNSPVCTASRQSFITGRLPHAVGVTRLTTPLPDDAVTLGDWLGDLGYDTAAIGKMHFNGAVEARLRRPARHARLGRVAPRPPARRGRPPPALAAVRRTRPPSGSTPRGGRSACRRRRWSRPTSSTARPSSSTGTRTRPDPDPFALVVGFPEPHSPFKFPDEWARPLPARRVHRPARLRARPPRPAQGLRRPDARRGRRASRRAITRRSRSSTTRSAGSSTPSTPRAWPTTRSWSTSATTATCSASTAGSRSIASTSPPSGSP